MHPGLPVAAPARAVPSTSVLSAYSIPSSPSRNIASSPSTVQHMQDADLRASIDFTRNLFPFPRASTSSRRPVLNHPRLSDLGISFQHTKRSATVPWDVLYHFLCVEVGEWFWDQGMDPEEILNMYNDDGTLKEIEEAPKPTWWQRWLSKRKRSANVWQNRWKRSHLLTKFQYDGVRFDELLMFILKSQREQYRSNPYNLSSTYYLLIFLSLAAWAIGSIVCGHYEARAKIEAGDNGALASLCRGLLGAIPAITQITLFLFPPLLAEN